MKAGLIFLAIALCGSSRGQMITGRATTVGQCSPATTGNNNIYYFKYCGIDPEEGKKLVKLLDAIVGKQDLTDFKLDQILKTITSLAPSPLDEAFEHLDGGIPSTLEKRLDKLTFNITNNSTHAILVKNVSCQVISAKVGNNIGFGPQTFDAGMTNTTLNPGGDAQSWRCPGPIPGLLVCADVVWKVTYAINSEPNNEAHKLYRFTMKRGDGRWTRTATTVAPLACGGTVWGVD